MQLKAYTLHIIAFCLVIPQFNVVHLMDIKMTVVRHLSEIMQNDDN